MRALTLALVLIFAGCNFDDALEAYCEGNAACADAGSATGGGTSTGGGDATGGGTATGGGSATGGGDATDGGAPPSYSPVTALEIMSSSADDQRVGTRSAFTVFPTIADGGTFDPAVEVDFDCVDAEVFASESAETSVTRGTMDKAWYLGALRRDGGSFAFMHVGKAGVTARIRDGGAVIESLQFSRTYRGRVAISGAGANFDAFTPFNCVPLDIELLGLGPYDFVALESDAQLTVSSTDGGLLELYAHPFCQGPPGDTLTMTIDAGTGRSAVNASLRFTERTSVRASLNHPRFDSSTRNYRLMELDAVMIVNGVTFDGGTISQTGGFDTCTRTEVAWVHTEQSPGVVASGDSRAGDTFPFALSTTDGGVLFGLDGGCGGRALTIASSPITAKLPVWVQGPVGGRLNVSLPDGGWAKSFSIGP